jgi:hypothetical protein
MEEGYLKEPVRFQLEKDCLYPFLPWKISDKEAPNSSVEQLHNIAKNDQDSVTSLKSMIRNTAVRILKVTEQIRQILKSYFQRMQYLELPRDPLRLWPMAIM